MNRFSRRRFITAAVATAAAGAGGGIVWWRQSLDRHAERTQAHDGDFPNPLRLPGSDGLFGVLDAPSPLMIIGKTIRHPIFPGKPASLLAYEVEHDGKTFLNPVLRVRNGAALRVKFWNALDEPSIIHWHGLKVESNNDGHPHYAVAGGATYDYQFTVANRSATYWYHPHPHGLTAKQIYLGMAGLFIVEDDEELRLQQALDLKLGVTDVPLLIQDKRLDSAGEPVYAPDTEERLHGYLGDQVLVNLTLQPHFDAATRIYRFRIINGSNARTYRLAFMHGAQPLAYHVIGGDGGLLERPYTVSEAFLSSAERLDVLLDLRNAHPGDVVMLASLPFDPMHLEPVADASDGHAPYAQHAGHDAPAQQHAHGALADGAAIELLRINVRTKVAYDKVLPQTLAPVAPIDVAGAKRRVLRLAQAEDTWRINGLTYDMLGTPIVVKRGSVEIWEIRNAARGMPHPMHVHGFPFQLLERSGSPEQQQRNAVNAHGLSAVDLGWKDTLLVWPGEVVRLAIDFNHPFLGDQVYMVHCHNLEHEDQGMMLNFRVAA